ncbi:MAG: DUF1016 N-terminal domain-containing protein [Nanoarchaeota archaeon]
MIEKSNYKKLISEVKKIVLLSKSKIYSTINITLVKTYYKIGKYILSYLEENKENENIFFEKLTKELKSDLGKGFSRSNLIYMRLFAKKYDSQTLSDQLSWSHYVELLNIGVRLEK